jgi:thioredoxin reductase
VHLVVRRSGLEETMSSYLIERIAATPNITLHTRLDLAALEGDDGGLSKVHCRGIGDGRRCVAFETGTCSCSSAPIPTATGCANARWAWTTRASC